MNAQSLGKRLTYLLIYPAVEKKHYIPLRLPGSRFKNLSIAQKGDGRHSNTYHVAH